MKLRSKAIVPCEGGWRYIQPETKFIVDAETFEQLVDRVTEHRRYKNIDPLDRKLVMLDIENQICERIKDEGNFVVHGS